MGLAIQGGTFSEADYQRFSERLHENLAVLKQVLADPQFGGEQRSYGAELELYIVDGQGRVSPCNTQIQAHHDDPLLTLELNRFNLEYNLLPVADSATPFSQLQNQLDGAIDRLRTSAAHFDSRLVPVGILPTLEVADFGPQCMTDSPRYHALTEGLKRIGSGVFKIHIDGVPPLVLERDDVTMEGANTSFQFHYRVQNQHFADSFNAFLLATPVILGLAANSPTVFGHRLWQETRVPLFKHSIDSRVSDTQWRQPTRVSMGQGWVRQSAYEIFAQTVAIHPPLLPVHTETDYQAQWRAGAAPSLDELRMHQNTVWPWLRPVYDPVADGHLRIELRVLPAGPSHVDMFANAAFYVGLAEGLMPYLNDLLPAMPFGYAKYNFYRAAQFGLDARMVWPNFDRHQLQEIPLRRLLQELLPIARQGLQRIGVAEAEIKLYLANIAERLDAGRNGANWQLDCLDRLEAQGLKRKEACHGMLEHYISNSAANRPISRWELP